MLSQSELQLRKFVLDVTGIITELNLDGTRVRQQFTRTPVNTSLREEESWEKHLYFI